MAQNNVIELVMKLVDQASAPMKQITGSIDNMSRSFLGIGLGSVAGIAGVSLAFKKVLAASSEAEQSVIKFERAFSAFSGTLNVPKKELEEFARATQASTRFSDEAVRDLQTKLVQFGTITGGTFRKAQQAAVDLAAGMGTDLAQAATIVGRSLAAPENAARLLRQANIVLSDSQKALIKNLNETGKSAQASDVVLQEISKRFSGAARQDINTYAGAVQNLKNNFEELFEQDTAKLTVGMNELSKIVKDPATKEAASALFGAIVSGASLALKALTPLISAFSNIISTSVSGYQQILDQVAARTGGMRTPLDDMKRELALLEAPGKILDSQARSRKKELKEYIQLVEQVAKKSRGDGLTEFAPKTNRASNEREQKAAAEEAMRGLGEFTPSVERAAFIQFNAGLEAALTNLQLSNAELLTGSENIELMGRSAEVAAENLKNLGLDPETVATGIERAGTALDEFNAKQEEARNLQAEVAKQTLARAEAATQAFTNVVKGAFEDMVNDGKLSVSRLVEFIIAELAKKALLNAIDNLSSSIGAAFGGTGIGAGIASFLGFRAGGGSASGPTVVGENGPELAFLPSGTRIVNQRQMAFSGAGGGVNFQPQSNVVIQARSDDAATLRQEFVALLSANNQRLKLDWLRTMQANGFGRLS